MSLVLCFVMTSCSNEDGIKAPVQSNGDEKSELLSRLQAYNDSLLAIHSNSSRGYFTNFLRACYIAVEDAKGAYHGGQIGGQIGSLAGPHGAAVGAAVGAVVCGAGASYGAYIISRASSEIPAPELVTSVYVDVYKSKVVYSDYYPQAISLQLPDGKTDLLEVGAKHNLVLDKLFATSTSTKIKKGAGNLPDEEANVLDSQEFADGYKAALAKLNSEDDSVDDGTTAGKTMNKYLNLISKSAESFSDFESISNDYINIITKSKELTDIEKDIVYSAICVAVSSVEYWYVNQ